MRGFAKCARLAKKVRQLYANGKYYVFTCSLLWYGSSDCAGVSCKASFSDAVLLSPVLPITSTVASIQIIAPLSLAALRQFGAGARSFASCSASGTTVSSALTVRNPDSDLLGAAVYFRNKEDIMFEGATACKFEGFCVLKSTLDEMRE
jgi:hypothetical protein